MLVLNAESLSKSTRVEAKDRDHARRVTPCGAGRVPMGAVCDRYVSSWLIGTVLGPGGDIGPPPDCEPAGCGVDYSRIWVRLSASSSRGGKGLKTTRSTVSGPILAGGRTLATALPHNPS